MNYTVFCDFDGTITIKDTTDEILSRFADPSWEDVEREWLDGKFGSEECLRRQMRLVKAGKEEIVSLLDTIEIDPFFSEFAAICGERGIPLYVVSDGFDFVINHILRKNGFGRLKHYANSLIFKGGVIDTAFSNSHSDCEECATCKVNLMKKLKSAGARTIVVGDGFSDRYIARCADHLFAKLRLKDVCEKEGIAHHAFDTFKDVNKIFKKILESKEVFVENQNGVQCEKRRFARV